MTLMSRYDDTRSMSAVHSSNRWRVAGPRRPGTLPSAARRSSGASSAGAGDVQPRMLALATARLSSPELELVEAADPEPETWTDVGAPSGSGGPTDVGEVVRRSSVVDGTGCR